MLKKYAKNVILAVTPALIRNRPIDAWPEWLGRIHGVRVPASVPEQLEESPRGEANINILNEMIDRTKSLKGAIADCGVYKAATTVAMALYMRQYGIQKRIYAFDSFQGYDSESVARDVKRWGGEDEACHNQKFSDSSIDEVYAKLRRFRIDNVELVPGYFNQTLQHFDGQVRFSFVHLDVNLYDSYRECLEFFYPRVEAGGIVLFDEYNDPPWPGCNKAVDEFLADKPEHLEMICRNNYQKWYFVKEGKSVEES